MKVDKQLAIILGSAGFIILAVLGVAIPNLGIALLIFLGLGLIIIPTLIYIFTRN